MKPVYAVGVIALFFAVVGAVAYAPQEESTTQSEVITQNGLHWHAKLTVRVAGEVVEIPANMGLGAVHNPIHTHDDEPGLIHMEFGGKVMRSDLALQKFFDVWGKNLGNAVAMTVNGEPSTKFQEYLMQDGDLIDISFEK
jgi:hypothetical protein